METLNAMLSKICFCFTSPAEEEPYSDFGSNMSRQYQNDTFPRTSAAQRDFISLRDQPNISGGSFTSFKSRTNGYTKVQDVNFDDRWSSTGSARTDAFVTASEGWGRSEVGGGSLRSRSDNRFA